MRDRAKFLVSLFLISTFAALLVRFLFVENFRVSSDSMRPNLLSGDLLLVSKFNYALRIPFTSIEFFRFRAPARGEVVVFALPELGMESFVKRVVALEGDTVAIKNGVLSVNGETAGYLEKPEYKGLKEETIAGQPARWIVPQTGTDGDYGPALVPRGHFFVLGDNRGESRDSRRWGPVPMSYVRGKAWIVWLSLGPGGQQRAGRTGLTVSRDLPATRPRLVSR